MIQSTYILAGGKSRRMECNKALLKWKEHTMIEELISTLENVFPKVTIIGKEEDYAFLKRPIISDIIQDLGPMGGLYTALVDAQEDVFLTACDMPFIDGKSIDLLIKHYEKNNTNGVVARNKDRIYPTIGIYSHRLIQPLEKCLNRHELRFRTFLQNHKIDYLDEVIDDKLLMNINTQEDYQKALMQLNKIYHK